MNLRPHHLLCIQKFTGHGYNEEFTAHMTDVVSELARNPATEITVTEGCDDLCIICPNNQDGRCSSHQKVTLIDSAVLRICEIKYGEKAPWADLEGKARERIFKTDEFHHVCSCCQWFDLCRRTEPDYE